MLAAVSGKGRLGGPGTRPGQSQTPAASVSTSIVGDRSARQLGHRRGQRRGVRGARVRAARDLQGLGGALESAEARGGDDSGCGLDERWASGRWASMDGWGGSVWGARCRSVSGPNTGQQRLPSAMDLPSAAAPPSCGRCCSDVATRFTQTWPGGVEEDSVRQLWQWNRTHAAGFDGHTAWLFWWGAL